MVIKIICVIKAFTAEHCRSLKEKGTLAPDIVLLEVSHGEYLPSAFVNNLPLCILELVFRNASLNCTSSVKHFCKKNLTTVLINHCKLLVSVSPSIHDSNQPTYISLIISLYH